MAIAPITGTLKRKIITDISLGFVAGFALAFLYWEVEHKPLIAKRDAYYAQLKKQKEIEESA
ncbi:Cytochrome c oxidase subunit 7A [Candida viswanathii]|uniref:Cytochrome c oxidase subunit 9, mitochondrial n=1 Tax=Candida viswanathii TaxID=5486 RepID=A0A367YM75_9ASCO|nr:Cytochrome c oxidase subunit 7A [Candida viswanathii]